MKNVVIIGAGPAGLTAAYQLLKNSYDKYKITIIEEDSQVGGISKTVNYKGNKIDIGGHGFFTKEKKVEKIWTDILKLQSEKSYDDKILNREKNYQKMDWILKKIVTQKKLFYILTIIMVRTLNIGG